MKKTFCKYLSLLLAVLLLLPLSSGTARAQEVASGDCGGDGMNLTWTLDPDGTLTISGTGPMSDALQNDAAWTALADTATSIVIESGVTSIGCSAFLSFGRVTDVSLPDTLERINDDAFSRCGSLTSVVIPDSVVLLGAVAFCGCHALTDVTFGPGIDKICECTFDLCESLTNVFYTGSEQDWAQIEFETLNDALKSAHIHYNATGHTPGAAEPENEVPPTCTEPGTVELVLRCAVCHVVLDRALYTTSPALGHGTQGVFESIVPATCTVYGYRMTVCLTCGEIMNYDILDIDPNNHDWDAWEVITQATEDSEGLMRRVCKNDPSHTEELVIPRYEEDEAGNPIAAIVEFVQNLEQTIADYTRGFIDWFLRLFHKP